MLTLQCVLLVVGAVLAIALAAGHHGDDWQVVLTGVVLVAAMAIQNGASRGYLTTAPPTTLMTGTTTQIMLDIADLIRGVPPETTIAAKARLAKMIPNVVAFAPGCGAAALVFSQFAMGCFIVPPVLAAIPVLMNATKEQV